MGSCGIQIRVHFVLIVLSFLFKPSIVTAQDAKSRAQKSAEVLPHMQLAYQSLIKVLDYTTRSEDPLKLNELYRAEDHFRVLSEQARTIHTLVKKDEKGKEYLAAELEKNAQLAYSRFKSGHRDQVKFYVSELVNNCFGCHTSRTSAADSRFTTAFAKDLQAIDMEPIAKARFLSLSRQFEASATAYEQIFQAKEFDLDGFINFDPLVEYLVLTLRVKDDAPRALKTLNQLKDRNLPAVLKREISSWAKALQTSDARALKGSAAQKAEDLIRDGRGSMEFPQDRTGVIQFILASKYLRDYLNEESVPAGAKAKAYYDLGGCELVLGTSFASDEANVYFAEAIRIAPKSDLAKKAFARYEENIYAGYSGSSGVTIPQDEKDNLDALKKMAF